MRVAFAYIDEEMVRKIITSFIRPMLEYAAVVWSPTWKSILIKLRSAKSSNKMGAKPEEPSLWRKAGKAKVTNSRGEKEKRQYDCYINVSEEKRRWIAMSI